MPAATRAPPSNGTPGPPPVLGTLPLVADEDVAAVLEDAVDEAAVLEDAVEEVVLEDAVEEAAVLEDAVEEVVLGAAGAPDTPETVKSLKPICDGVAVPPPSLALIPTSATCRTGSCQDWVSTQVVPFVL